MKVRLFERPIEIDGVRFVGELLQGELLQGELLQGELLQGELLQGELLQGELLQGELLQGELLSCDDVCKYRGGGEKYCEAMTHSDFCLCLDDDVTS
jgi:hypothetical protein